MKTSTKYIPTLYIQSFFNTFCMNYDDLKSVWICHICKFDFVFKSDVESHVAETGHESIGKYDMVSSLQVDT
jgi:hypothetical protein